MTEEDNWPIAAQLEVRRLRSENAKRRVDNNELRSRIEDAAAVLTEPLRAAGQSA